jgi:ABC-type Zn2+ transport system substrate-binding protein/surface adhesin
MAEPVLGPSTAGSVVLELGETVGVLVIEATAELNRREIEISPVGGDGGHQHGHGHDHAHDHGDAHVHRTHSMVRERGTAAGKS